MQVVPGGIESVNGSDVTMGCTSPLVDSGGVIVCPSDSSYLFDGCSPDIDTSASDWASQLVTVRNNGQTDTIPFILTFGLDTPVSLTGFELDLFLCPEWKIGVLQVSLSMLNKIPAYTLTLHLSPLISSTQFSKSDVV